MSALGFVLPVIVALAIHFWLGLPVWASLVIAKCDLHCGSPV
jgi:hypothetical protein